MVAHGAEPSRRHAFAWVRDPLVGHVTDVRGVIDPIAGRNPDALAVRPIAGVLHEDASISNPLLRQWNTSQKAEASRFPL